MARALRSKALDALLYSIQCGQLVPGQTYRTEDLAQQYGVSRTPVREALAELESKGLVQVVRGQGFTVTEQSADDARHVAEVRQILEMWVMRRIAGRLSDDALAELTDLIAEIEVAAQADDLVAYQACDAVFHLRIAELAGNPRLVGLLDDLGHAQYFPQMADIVAAHELVSRNDEHRQLVAALAEGDGELAALLIHRHRRV